MREAIREIMAYRDFLREFTMQTLRSRYRGSVLGFFWTLLNPLLIIGSLSFVFSYINHADLRTFGVYFFSGYVPWMFFVAATTTATSSIVGNAHYVTRIYLPKAIFPVWAMLINLTDVFAGMAILFVLMVIQQAAFTPALAILPISLLLLLVFVLGLSFLLGAISVFLRDFQFLWVSVTFLWFFCSPILYPITSIPEGPRSYFVLNPIIPFLELFQYPVSKGILPPAETWMLSVSYSVVALIVGVFFFARSQDSFYLYL